METGLNGTPVLTVKDMPIGRVDGTPYGYKRDLLVTVDIRMEHRADETETTEHNMTTDFLDFAITTAVWRPDRRDWTSGGATVAPLREVIANGRYEQGWNAGRVAALAELERWHLNAMKAGCAHQTVVWEDSRYGRRPSLELTPVCQVRTPYRPVNGYRYGHAWLVELLPKGFLDTVRGLFADCDQTRVYDSAQQAPRLTDEPGKVTKLTGRNSVHSPGEA
jgi:hypothetical protein